MFRMRENMQSMRWNREMMQMMMARMMQHDQMMESTHAK
jgi:hypothetical protein